MLILTLFSVHIGSRTGNLARPSQKLRIEIFFYHFNILISYVPTNNSLYIWQVAPISVHPTIDKAAHYFGLDVIHTPMTSDFKADVRAIEQVGTSLFPWA